MGAFVLLSLAKGSDRNPSIVPDLTYCGFSYWGLNVGMVVVCFLISILVV